MQNISTKWKEVSRRKFEFMANIGAIAQDLPAKARKIADEAPDEARIFIRERRRKFQVVVFAPSLGFGVGFTAKEIRPDNSRPTLDAYYRRYSRSVRPAIALARAVEAIRHIEDRERIERRGRRAASKSAA